MTEACNVSRSDIPSRHLTSLECQLATSSDSRRLQQDIMTHNGLYVLKLTEELPVQHIYSSIKSNPNSHMSMYGVEISTHIWLTVCQIWKLCTKWCEHVYGSCPTTQWWTQMQKSVVLYHMIWMNVDRVHNWSPWGSSSWAECWKSNYVSQMHSLSTRIFDLNLSQLLELSSTNM